MTNRSRILAAAAVAAGFIAMPGIASASQSQLETIVVLGAIKDPANAQYAKAPEDKSVPALPVVYEAAPAAKAEPASVNSKAPS